ncbi:MAG: PilZ domain-containing protein [Paraglaciecola sp.]|uniref:PilZ domain-containing protein n=1 Tax=Paraglaciecola sp. TaxID=1920173 RepID=UPI00273D3C2D|nr:PilZ domain-containing protein [Paraglaciecola sp.]MDP5031914.1 PilZ domain-containing protein [Paraglaciecola sp.]MDP5134069.1 PilZ domain-containing protein [Paraglaciecola sp.]
MLEKRQHSRVLVEDLQADICFTDPDSDHVTVLTGGVVDMSYSGIKIKLGAALPNIPSLSKISIVLTSASLSTPMTIKGMVRHTSEQNECGIAFSSENGASDVGEYLFECIRKVPHNASV